MTMILLPTVALLFCPLIVQGGPDPTVIFPTLPQHKSTSELDSGEWGKALFKSDFGVSLKTSECPSNVKDKPKIMISATDYMREYLEITCLARYPIRMDFEGNKPFTPIARHVLANADPSNGTEACYIINLSYTHEHWSSPVGNHTCTGIYDTTKTVSRYLYAQENWSIVKSKFDYDQFPTQSFNAIPGQSVFINSITATGWVIPCPAFMETVEGPTLKREMSQGGLQVDVPRFQGYNMTYDPTQGFTVTYKKPSSGTPSWNYNQSTPSSVKNSVHMATTSTGAYIPLLVTTVPTGKYLCTDSNTAPPSTLDILVEHVDFLVFPNHTNLTTNKENLVKLECHASSAVTLKVLQKSKMTEVKGTVSRKFKREGYTYNAQVTLKTTPIDVATASATVACVDAGGKTLYTWKIDNAYKCTCSWLKTKPNQFSTYSNQYGTKEEVFGEYFFSKNADDSDWTELNYAYSNGDLTCENGHAKSLLFNAFSCRSPTECGYIRNALAKSDTALSHLKDNHFYQDEESQGNSATSNTHPRSGFIHCLADNYVSELEVNMDLEGELHFGEDALVLAQSDPELLLIHTNTAHVYKSDKTRFTCMGASEGVMAPLIWSFQYADGSLNYSTNNYVSTKDVYDGLQMAERASDDRILLGNKAWGPFRRSYLTIPIAKVTSICCFAPKTPTDSGAVQWTKVCEQLDLEEAAPTDTPPECPTTSAPFIIMERNSSGWNVPRSRIRTRHLVSNMDVKVYENVDSVSLYCLAKYPVMWTKDGQEIPATWELHSDCKKSDGGGMSLYNKTLTISTTAFNATGNYTCASMTPHKSTPTSLYLYAMNPENSKKFINSGTHHLIKVNEIWNKKGGHKTWVVLPCRINHPDVVPYLFIDRTEEDKVTPINLDPDVLKFDPKIGFLLDVSNRKLIPERKTILFCSDEKDGSFIGVMMTLEFHEEQEAVSHPIFTSPTATPTPININHTGHTHPEDSLSPHSHTGYLLIIVLLSASLVASLFVIWNFYRGKLQSIQQQQVGQETDWTKAASHAHLGRDREENVAVAAGIIPLSLCVTLGGKEQGVEVPQVSRSQQGVMGPLVDGI